MIQKNKLKIMIDVMMSIILLFLMVFQVTGAQYHEWFGAAMLILFMIHNGLNHKWYHALLKGKWTISRAVHTMVNLTLLIAFILTAYSGIEMSRHVFDFLPDFGRASVSRKIHLASSSWTFVLMSIHLGFHRNQMSTKCMNVIRKRKITFYALNVVEIIFSLYGMENFIKEGILSNLFLLNEFALMDYKTSSIIVFSRNVAMMWSISFISYWLLRGFKWIKKNKSSIKMRN